MNIYLAGKCNEQKRRIVKPFKYKHNFYSSCGSNHSEHDLGGALYEISDCQTQYQDEFLPSALRSIAESDMLLAFVYDTSAYGTVAEIAYAASKGIPCHVIVKSDITENNHQMAMTDAYWFVCCFPGVRAYEVSCECQVIKILDKILS